MSTNFLDLLSRLTTRKLSFLTEASDNGFVEVGVGANVEDGANVVMSRHSTSSCSRGGDWEESDPFWNPSPTHAVLLDLDVPAYLIPSSTPGHSHLYIDVAVPEEDYFDLLYALARCGVIEDGYAHASKKKGGTFLRLPWVKKGVAA